MINVSINKNDQNKRLDNFVKKYLNNAPLSLIYKLFRKKDIKVNNKPEKPEYITKLNDVITIYINDEKLNGFKEVKTSVSQNFTVIYEDDNVLIVNKPVNLLVHEGNNKNEDNLSWQVLNYLIKNKSYEPEQENSFVPALAHRIDRNTSGIVVFGKTSMALQELFKAFKKHEGMQKQYITLVAGKTEKKGRIDAPLIKDEQSKLVNVDLKKGLRAISEYKTIKQFDDCSLLEVNILTGRTHQIRAHLKFIDHPIIGDKKYGNINSDRLAKKYNLKNYILHAKRICFDNLENGLAYLNMKDFVAPLEEWQQKIIEKLIRGDGGHGISRKIQ